MSALFVCKCLNVILESEKVEDNVDMGKLELTPSEQRDIFFSEKLVSCPVNAVKTQVVQPALIGQRTVGRWLLNSCLACGQTTHALLQDRSNAMLICKSIFTTTERVNNLKKSKNFSPVFHMLVPEVTSDVEMKENMDTNNVIVSNRKGWQPTQQVIGSLSKQLNQTLQSQLESVEETVRQFRDQKYAEFEAYREKAHRDHKILASIVSKARSNSDGDSWRIDTSLDNGPPSPQLPPLQRRRLSSFKDAKKLSQIKPNRNFPPEEDSLDAEDIFDLEGTDSHHNMVSDQDDYDSDQGSNDEGIHISRPRGGGGAADIARSLPVNMPSPSERRDIRDLEDDEEPHDIAASIKALARSVHGDPFELPRPRFSTQIYASRLGTDAKPRTAMVLDEDDELYTGFNDVAPALDTRNLREDQAFQETLRTAGIGRKVPTRMGTGMYRLGTVSVRGGSSRAGTAAARPVTAVRAAGYTSTARDTPSRDDKKEDSIEERIKQMELRIMALVEDSCMLSARPAPDDDSATTKREYDLGLALAKAQEASAMERQLIRMQEQANLGDSHNLDLTFAVLCNLAGQYALNEMYTEALNTYQLLTRNKLFPHANRLKVNMGNIYFKMGEHPKALKLYRMALDQTPTAEKDLRMKVMHNIGLLLVRMGKFRDAVTNFQHIMHEQGDFQTGLHLVLCSVALNDEEGGKAAFHAMLDVEPPTHHQDIPIDDENDAYECVVRDVLRADRLSRWSRRAAADAERCLALAAAALVRPASRDDESGGMSWCVEALRGYSGGGAGARLELGGALAGLRAGPGGRAHAAGLRALQRLKAVARAHVGDRVLRAEANADAAFVAYALGNWSEARSLSESAAREDPYSCAARVCGALAAARDTPAPGPGPTAWRAAAAGLAAACHLDPADLVAVHDLALALESSEEESSIEAAEARWARTRSAGGAGGTLRALAAGGLARLARRRAVDPAAAEHWYSMIGGWDAGVTCALAQLHSEMGDTQTAKHHYQDVEAAWPCELSALEWLARDAQPPAALQYYRRAARLQPNNPQWSLLMGGCLRASGKYQEALSLYKKMNARFPDNVQCLKLIVKLCGDQGLSETSAWTRELQRAQARLKQQERASSVTSLGSGSSGTSQSPIDHIRAAGSRTGSAAPPPTTGSRHSSDGRADSARTLLHTYAEAGNQDNAQSVSRSVHRPSGKKKHLDEFDDDLPLPPE